MLSIEIPDEWEFKRGVEPESAGDSIEYEHVESGKVASLEIIGDGVNGHTSYEITVEEEDGSHVASRTYFDNGSTQNPRKEALESFEGALDNLK